MNTDASTRRHTDSPNHRTCVNVLYWFFRRTVQHLSQSIIQFRNEWDLRERSDSAAVSESISISMTNRLDAGLKVLVPGIFARFPYLRRPLVVIVPFWGVWWANSITGLSLPVCSTWNELRGTFWLRFGVHGFSDAVEASTVGSLARHLDTKFFIIFDFAVTLSSLASSCVLFVITCWCNWNGQCWTNTKDGSTHDVWNFLWSAHVCELVFGFNIFDLDLGVHIDSVKQPNLTRHCVFLTSVSSSNFFRLRSSWLLLRCLQKCTT